MGYSGEQKREYQRVWIAKRRQDWIDANGPCVDCGSSENLEIDHVDPNEKLYNPRDLWSRTEEFRLAELAKCVVRCQDCYLKKTIKERIGKNKHGTMNMYRKYKCRCDLCLEAKRIQKRKDYEKYFKKT